MTTAHGHLEAGWACFGPNPEVVQARLRTVELVMEMHISAAWHGSARPKVPMEMPHLFT